MSTGEARDEEPAYEVARQEKRRKRQQERRKEQRAEKASQYSGNVTTLSPNELRRRAHIELGLWSADTTNELRRRSHLDLGRRNTDGMNVLKRKAHIDIGRSEDGEDANDSPTHGGEGDLEKGQHRLRVVWRSSRRKRCSPRE